MKKTKTRTKHNDSICQLAGCYEADRSRGWGIGPWDGEPNRIDFTVDGLDCFIHRSMHTTGSWCGYVGVPRKHPLFGKRYDRVDSRLHVHGGLTFSAKCGRQTHLCHEGGPRWWFGFDCAHAGDFSPKLDATVEEAYRRLGDERPKRPSRGPFREHYWTAEEVIKETAKLAHQVARFTSHRLPPLPRDRAERRRVTQGFKPSDFRKAVQEMERARRLKELIAKTAPGPDA